MNLSSLTAIGPIDGRYHSKTIDLAPFLSEFGLIKYRVFIEVEYFIELTDLGLQGMQKITSDQAAALRNLVTTFSEKDALWIKEKEAITNHDVKAVEYFVKNKLEQIGLGEMVEFVHFGLTSQDINNTAVPLSLRDAFNEVILTQLDQVRNQINELATQWEDIPMLSRTHGQPASPTRLGKELRVFSARLDEQIKSLKDTVWAAKFGGATGGLNAHYVAYPGHDWHGFANTFTARIGLTRSFPTTQIEHYDHLAAFFDGCKRVNTIYIDFCRDIWTYISMDYFKQKIKTNEVGSSAMPHKVNPIDFENAEGNFGVANALFEHLSAKLPISRLQRDLTDSTVLRTIGMPLGHTLIALKSLNKGIGKLILNRDKIEEDLENNWAVIAEAIQTILRREHYPQPYEALKGLTRTHGTINQESLHSFIDQLEVSDAIKKEMKLISPFNYTGK